ncbi:MAG: NfeD family protein [Candidatus Methanomethylophilaceae archaeon]|nr:NfeD family protein [Candidatus Methanomethylophilaceae archaeon]
MEAATVALIIIIIGAFLILMEAMSPGAFMVIPGTVLVIVGTIGYIVPDFMFSIYAPIVGIVIAIPITVATIFLYQFLAKPVPPATTVSDSLIGKKGKVVAETGPNDLKGKVRIGMEIWSANSEEPIGEGEPVEVVAAEGVHITVIKRKKEATE